MQPLQRSMPPLVPSFVVGLLLVGVAPAQEYQVTDVGATGDNGNMAWSLNQPGDVCGWSDFIDAGTEGFLYREGRVRYVGFVQGRSSSNLVAVNNLGHAVGSSGTVHEEPRAFVWLGTHRVNLGTLGGDDSRGHGINDLGQAVGSSKRSDGSWRGFIWENGEMRALPTLPGGEHAGADWINNAGEVVGTSEAVPGSRQHYAVIWEDEQVHQLPPLNGLGHIPNYIHDNGDIAGFARLPEFEGRPRAVIWRDREIVLRLGTLADDTPFEPIAISTAYGINADGVIVGMSTPATGDGYVPFVYRDGEMIRLDDLMPAPWVAYSVGPGAINDAGQIAVKAGIPGSGSRALLLTPRVVGDVDGDGCVDFSDILLILAAWGDEGGPEDLDGSGFVGFDDLLLALNAWAPCP